MVDVNITGIGDCKLESEVVGNSTEYIIKKTEEIIVERITLDTCNRKIAALKAELDKWKAIKAEVEKL